MCAKSSIASIASNDVMQPNAVIQHVFMLLLNKILKKRIDWLLNEIIDFWILNLC